MFLALLGGRVCGRQQKKMQKQNKLSTRGCSFGVPLNTRGDLTRTPHGKKHILNTRGCLTRTPHGALKGTKAHYALKRRHTLYQDVQLSISCRCQIRCLWLRFEFSTLWWRVVVVVVVSLVFYCGFLFNSPHDISQSMRK